MRSVIAGDSAIVAGVSAKPACDSVTPPRGSAMMPPLDLVTVAASLQSAARALEGVSDSPRLDAEILLSEVLGVPRTGLIVQRGELVAAERREAYDRMIERRMQGTPVAYLTGSREFWSLNLRVTPDVLVPRPETELLVELALSLNPESRPWSVLDLGTGSGAIALAIATSSPAARVTGIDVSAPALAVAAENSRRLGALTVCWRRGCWFDAVPGERFDCIVANPPYIAADDPALPALAAEPALALCSGPTGLEALAQIADGAASHLQPRGYLLLEHGSTQADAVAAMLADHGFEGIQSHRDYSGRPRVTLGAVRAE